MNSIFLVLASFVAVYVGILFLLNFIPHVTIRSLGWLSLTHVSIETKQCKINIRRIKLTFKLFKSNDSVKPLHLEFSDMDIHVHETEKKKKKIKNPVDSLPDISFFLPKFAYNFLVKTHFVNQFQIHFFRYSILHDETDRDLQLFFEYSRIEQSLVDVQGKFTFMIVNGHIRNRNNIKNQQSLFRSFEFSVSCDTIITCPIDDPKVVKVQLNNFSVKSSVGRFTIPVEILDIETKLKKKREKKSLEKKDEADPGDTVVDKSVGRPFPMKLLNDVINLIDTIDFKVEDFQLVWGNYEVQIANFSTRLDWVESYKYSTTLVKLGVYMTSFKLFEKLSKCLELPSSSFTTEAQILPLIDGIINILDPNQQKPIDFETSLTISSPSLQVYYDQIERFLALPSEHKEKGPNPLAKYDIGAILNKLSMLSLKVYVVDFNLLHFSPDPTTLPVVNFKRDDKNNLVSSLSILSIVHRVYTRQYRDMVRNSKSQKKKINSMLLVKNLKFDSMGNSIHFPKLNTLASYDINQNEVSLNLRSKSLRVKSVNEALFLVVREFGNRRIIRHNNKYSFMSAHRQPQTTQFLESEYTTVVPYVKLFELISPIFAKIRLSISNIQTDIICKDGLPSHIVYDESLGKDIDLADFKRGISLRIDEVDFNYKLSKKIFDFTVKQLQCFTLSEYSNEFITDFDEVQEYKASDSEFSDISSVNSAQSFIHDEDGEMEDLGCKKLKKVILLRDLKLSNADRNDGDVDRLSLVIPEVDGRIDIFFIWCAVYAKTLLTYFAPTVQRNYTKEEMVSVVGHKNKLKLDIFVESIAMVVRLPHTVDVMIEFDSLRFKNVFISKSLDLRYARLFVIHPATKKWTRLFIIKEPVVNVNLTHALKNSVFRISTGAIRINVPHLFAVYTVIDNMLTFFKAIIQILHNFKNHSMRIGDYERLLPKEKPAVELPRIYIKSAIFGITIENDPFETELAYIYELGLIEQRERIVKLKLFEQGASEIMAQSEPSIESKINLSDLKPVKSNTARHPLLKLFGDNPATNLFKDKLIKFKNTKNIPIGDVYDSTPPVASSDAEEKIRKAKELFDASLSNSWIKKFRLFRESKIKQWKDRQLKAWGNVDISKLITDKFDIVDYPTGPHLVAVIVRDLDWTMEKPQIEDLDQFLYTHAKKQPKLKYSILMPMHLSLKCKSLNIFLRDYPLPLISFPESSKGSQPSVHFHGNLVIHETLVKNQNQMRHIYVPFSPAAPLGELADVFYSVYIPRTLETVKITIDLQWDITAEDPCILTWCKSYQPAILTAAAALDNFTKPEVDDSPLGWWDKFALLMHGRMRFNIQNELCFNIKGSTSPYQMSGKAAGFVFCWKDDVTLKINYDDLSRELIQLDANAFVLAIPNYSLQDKCLWGSFFADIDEQGVEIDESKRWSKKVIRLSSSDRVRWTLGMIYERNVDCSMVVCDSKERTSLFQPHYDVVITNPAFPDHKDSFKSYRSTYIHMALSVVSIAPNGNCFNAGYFTPLAFHYFFDWWNILHEGISLPIRQGKLFLSIDMAKKKTHVEMGAHIVTVKYLFQFDPVTISHVYKYPSSIDEDSRIAFTGIKARFSNCTIDLHQRKEMIAYVNEKLNINNQVAHLKMNLGEIDVQNADIRIVNATFSERSIRGYLLSNMAGYAKSDISQFTTKPPKVDINNYEDWIAQTEVSDNDYTWIDAEDFIELEMKEPLSPYPKIQILSFCTSPGFGYFREFNDQKDGLYPYGTENSHNCIIGIQKPEATQAELLSKRIDEIKKSILSTNEKLKNMSTDSTDYKKFVDVLKHLKENLDVVESVWESFTGESILSENTISTSTDLTRPRSRQLSVYSTHTTNEEMRIASQVDANASNFRNRFIVHNMQLQWNNRVRDLFSKYLQKVNDRKSLVYFMSKQAIDFVESVINETPEMAQRAEFKEDSFTNDFKRGADVINSFYDDIDDTESEDQEAENIYLVKFIHPQLQLTSEKEEDTCVTLVSRDLQLRILDIRKKGTIQMVNKNSELEGLVESRFGVLFEDSQAFVQKKGDIFSFNLGQLDSGTVSSWPTWLETEVCYDSSFIRDKLVVEKNTMGLIYNKPNPMFSASNSTKCNVITVQLSKIVMNATSEQYSTLYYVATNLLLASKGDRDDVYNRLDKVISLSDISDLQGLDTRASELQQKIRIYKQIVMKLSYSSLDDDEKVQLTSLEFELEKLWLELSALLEGLRLKSLRYKSDKSRQQVWNILADQVIWHLLDSKREPFVDFALHNPKFARIDAFDGSKLNKIEIGLMQGFNLQESSIYPELLQVKDEDSDLPVISVTWTLLEPVGGIPVLQSAKLEIQPLIVQLDFATAKELFRYLFPKDETQLTTIENGKDSNGKTGVSSTNSSVSRQSATVSRSSTIDSDRSSKNPFKMLRKKIKESTPDSSLAPSPSSVSLVSKSDSGSGSGSGSGVFSNDDRSKTTNSSQPKSTTNSSQPKSSKSTKSGRRKKIKDDGKDDLTLIVSRSSKFMSIVDMDISKFNLIVSFRAPPHLKFLDAHKLSLNIPNLRYQEKFWSVEDIILHIRKDIIRIILSHTGKIIGNKFKIRKRSKAVQPLKQIADFSSFLTVKDLQEVGRSRDSSKQLNGHSHPHPLPHHRKTHSQTHSETHSETGSQESTLHPSVVNFEKVLQEIIDEDEEDDDDTVNDDKHSTVDGKEKKETKFVEESHVY